MSRSLLVKFVDALFVSTSSCSFPCGDILDKWLRMIFHHNALLGLSQENAHKTHRKFTVPLLLVV
jgi:hypothetical protein